MKTNRFKLIAVLSLALCIFSIGIGLLPNPLRWILFGKSSDMSSANGPLWFELSAKQADGQLLSMESLRGRVVLVVNVASRCGFTPQYKQLQELHDRYSQRGLSILAFPCNQFGSQEPGTEAEILQFCSTNYGVSFPVMSKVQVNGPGSDPVFDYLKKQAPGLLGSEAIKWNFTKFLVDGHGKVHSRYAPTTSPSDIAKDIEKLLPGSEL